MSFFLQLKREESLKPRKKQQLSWEGDKEESEKLKQTWALRKGFSKAFYLKQLKRDGVRWECPHASCPQPS